MDATPNKSQSSQRDEDPRRPKPRLSSGIKTKKPLLPLYGRNVTKGGDAKTPTVDVILSDVKSLDEGKRLSSQTPAFEEVEVRNLQSCSFLEADREIEAAKVLVTLMTPPKVPSNYALEQRAAPSVLDVSDFNSTQRNVQSNSSSSVGSQINRPTAVRSEPTNIITTPRKSRGEGSGNNPQLSILDGDEDFFEKLSTPPSSSKKVGQVSGTKRSSQNTHFILENPKNNWNQGPDLVHRERPGFRPRKDTNSAEDELDGRPRRPILGVTLPSPAIANKNGSAKYDTGKPDEGHLKSNPGFSKPSTLSFSTCNNMAVALRNAEAVQRFTYFDFDMKEGQREIAAASSKTPSETVGNDDEKENLTEVVPDECRRSLDVALPSPAIANNQGTTQYVYNSQGKRHLKSIPGSSKSTSTVLSNKGNNNTSVALRNPTTVQRYKHVERGRELVEVENANVAASTSKTPSKAVVNDDEKDNLTEDELDECPRSPILDVTVPSPVVANKKAIDGSRSGKGHLKSNPGSSNSTSTVLFNNGNNMPVALQNPKTLQRYKHAKELRGIEPVEVEHLNVGASTSKTPSKTNGNDDENDDSTEDELDECPRSPILDVTLPSPEIANKKAKVNPSGSEKGHLKPTSAKSTSTLLFNNGNNMPVALRNPKTVQRYKHAEELREREPVEVEHENIAASTPKTPSKSLGNDDEKQNVTEDELDECPRSPILDVTHPSPGIANKKANFNSRGSEEGHLKPTTASSKSTARYKHVEELRGRGLVKVEQKNIAASPFKTPSKAVGNSGESTSSPGKSPNPCRGRSAARRNRVGRPKNMGCRVGGSILEPELITVESPLSKTLPSPSRNPVTNRTTSRNPCRAPLMAIESVDPSRLAAAGSTTRGSPQFRGFASSDEDADASQNACSVMKKLGIPSALPDEENEESGPPCTELMLPVRTGGSSFLSQWEEFPDLQPSQAAFLEQPGPSVGIKRKPLPSTSGPTKKWKPSNDDPRPPTVDRSSLKARQAELKLSKKNARVIPLPGILIQKKQNSPTLKFKDLADRVESVGTPPDISSVNAIHYRFNGADSLGSQSDSGLIADSCLLVESEDGTIGLEEVTAAFMTSPHVNPRLVPYGWVDNHFKWIVWKLACYDRMFPGLFTAKCLSVENVLLQLKYRYDREIDRAQRPAFKKLLEGDAAPTKFVCCVASVKENFMEASLEFELTDGWYSIWATVDSEMVDLYNRGRVRVGTKLVVHGAEIKNCEQGCDALNVPSTVRLQISTNSVRRARWYAKMGFTKDNAPLPTSVSSVLPRGGTVGLLKAGIVVRKYPAVYKSTDADGRPVHRSERAQAAFEDQQDKRKSELAEVAFERVWKEVEAKYKKPLNRSKPISQQEISTIQDPKVLYSIVDGDDSEHVQNLLSAEQLRTVYNYRDKMLRDMREDVAREVQKQLDQLSTKAIKIVKIRIRDYSEDAVLTLWRPTEEDTATITENHVYDFRNVTAVGTKDKILQLESRRNTTFALHNALKVNQFRRVATTLKAIERPNFSPPFFGELDTAGVVVLVKLAEGSRGQTDVYLTDLQGHFLSITFWTGLEVFGCEGLLTEGSIIAACNLQWRPVSRQRKIPSVFASELSSFSKNPKQPHLDHYVNEIRSTLNNEESGDAISRAKTAIHTTLAGNHPSSKVGSPALRSPAAATPGTPVSCGTPARSYTKATIHQRRRALLHTPGNLPMTPTSKTLTPQIHRAFKTPMKHP